MSNRLAVGQRVRKVYPDGSPVKGLPVGLVEAVSDYHALIRWQGYQEVSIEPIESVNLAVVPTTDGRSPEA